MKKIVFVFLLLIGSLQHRIVAQTINPAYWVANAEVKSMLNHNDTVYMGGSFTRISPSTGGAIPVSLSNAGDTIAGFPHLCGSLRACISDEQGGWYIGGSFTCAGGLARNNIAHILPDFSVDVNFHPDIVGGEVYTLSLLGANLYIGGGFSSVSGSSRLRLAAVDKNNGSLLAWNPITSLLPNSAATLVYSVLASGHKVFVGGNFNTLSAAPRKGVASIDTAGLGVIDQWNPAGDIGGCANLVSNYAVRSMLMYNANLIVGGDFDSIGGCGLRQYLAALDTATGQHTNWRPSSLLSANNTVSRGVYCMAIAGDTLYAGGSFDKLGGVSSNHLVACSLVDTGYVFNWVSQMNPAGATVIVYSLVVDGNTVYAGGNFTTAGGTPVLYMAAVNRTSAFANSAWHPDPNMAPVYALSAKGDTLYAGGAFSGVRGLLRNRLARFNAITGQIDPYWNPNVGGPTNQTNIVNTIIAKDTTIFIGGNFSTVGTATRYDLAEIGMGYAGASSPWGPSPVVATTSIMVNALAFSNTKDTLYVGGSFVSMGGQARNRIAALSPYSNAALAWNPNAKNTVYSLIAKDELVYAGGLFDTINGLGRKRIAAIEASTGLPTSWDPGASITSATNAGAILAIAMSEDSIIYAGGAYTGMQGRSRLAAINTNTGVVRSAFNPNPTANQVNCLFIKDDSLVYAGGTFTNIGGVVRNRAAVLSATDGSAYIWNPSPDNTVDAIIESGGSLMLSGLFKCINTPAIPSAYFAGLQGSCLSSFGSASDTSLCAGDTVMLHASGGIAYAWSPTSYLDAPTSATPNANPPLTTNYTVTISAIGGCAQQIPITVTVHNPPITPEISLCSGTAFVCEPDSVCLTTGIENQYLWSPTGASTQKIYATTSGDYSVKITDVNQCSSYSIPITVTIYPIPAAPDIIVSGGILTTSTTAPVYQWWILAGGTWFPISGATMSFYQPTSPGIFKVCISDVNTCENCSAPFEVLALDNLASRGFSLNVSPNPAIGSAQVQLSLAHTTRLSLEVYNVLGAKIEDLDTCEFKPAGQYFYSLNLPGPGIYMVRMVTDAGEQVTRLVHY